MFYISFGIWDKLWSMVFPPLLRMFIGIGSVKSSSLQLRLVKEVETEKLELLDLPIPTVDLTFGHELLN